jgi:hypothetical protein
LPFAQLGEVPCPQNVCLSSVSSCFFLLFFFFFFVGRRDVSTGPRETPGGSARVGLLGLQCGAGALLRDSFDQKSTTSHLCAFDFLGAITQGTHVQGKYV